MIQELRVRMIGESSGKTTDGRVRVRVWDADARRARAMKAWGFSWVGAFAAIFLPLVHFVLVPLLVLAGPVFAVFILRQKTAVLGGEGTCPECGQAFQVAPGPDRFPIKDLCTHCQRNVRVERV